MSHSATAQPQATSTRFAISALALALVGLAAALFGYTILGGAGSLISVAAIPAILLAIWARHRSAPGDPGRRIATAAVLIAGVTIALVLAFVGLWLAGVVE